MQDQSDVVVFRKWRDTGDVIALFPEIQWSATLVKSYEHVGQHGAANYDSVIRHSVAATPDEYAPLKAELEAAPYNYVLDVRKRRR